MDAIVFPTGEQMSSPGGEFHFSPGSFPIPPMKTVEETRRERLLALIEKEGSLANLLEKIGLARNENSRLSRIANANVRHERGGKPYVMGSPMAREIEEKLNLPTGWMDTPPSPIETYGMTAPLERMAELFAVMEPEMQYKVVRMVAALNEQADGTNGANH